MTALILPISMGPQLIFPLGVYQNLLAMQGELGNEGTVGENVTKTGLCWWRCLSEGPMCRPLGSREAIVGGIWGAFFLNCGSLRCLRHATTGGSVLIELGWRSER